AKRLGVVVRVLPTQAEKRPAIQAQCGHVTAEIGFDQRRSEDLVPGGDGSVRREAGPGLDDFAGGGEIELLFLHEHANSLQRAERRVALIQMANRRLLAERPQRPYATDAEDNLLLDAVFFVAAVKLSGNVAV